MICTMVVRTLVLTTALAAALTPVWCFGEDVNPLPAKAIKELPRQLLSLIEQKKMTKYSAILVRVFKEEAVSAGFPASSLGLMILPESTARPASCDQGLPAARFPHSNRP